jgi:hypothetical protein
MWLRSSQNVLFIATTNDLPCLLGYRSEKRRSLERGTVITKTATTKGGRRPQKWQLSRYSIIVCPPQPSYFFSTDVWPSRSLPALYHFFLSISCLPYIITILPASRGVLDNLWLRASVYDLHLVGNSEGTNRTSLMLQLRVTVNLGTHCNVTAHRNTVP